MNSRYLLARLTFWLIRFKTLARAMRIFSSVKSPCFIKRSFFNYTLCLDVSRSITHQLLFLEGERFVEERFLLSTLLKPGMRVVDVGANVGYYLLLFEKYIKPAGEVVCIEPSHENLQELKGNIEVNKLTNVKLFEAAIGMEDSNIGLSEGINSKVIDKDHGDYQVTLSKLDSLVADKVDFLKIDVEGYEGQVLKGAYEIINRDKPVLFLELHPNMLPGYGFSIEQILNDLSKTYNKIDIYENQPEESLSLSGKFSIRYLMKDNMVKISNAREFIDKYSKQEMPDSLWAVCRS